jgi:hypothetical protein
MSSVGAAERSWKRWGMIAVYRFTAVEGNMHGTYTLRRGMPSNGNRDFYLRTGRIRKHLRLVVCFMCMWRGKWQNSKCLPPSPRGPGLSVSVFLASHSSGPQVQREVRLIYFLERCPLSRLVCPVVTIIYKSVVIASYSYGVCFFVLMKEAEKVSETLYFNDFLRG